MPARFLACSLTALLCACTPPDTGDTRDSPVMPDPVATDIWVAELLDSGRRLRLGTPVNATDRDGYDNQPHFLPDGGAFLYTSIGRDGIADVWRYDLERGRRTRVTRTPYSEYSPTPLPDGSGFAVVRVEADGRQRLWRMDHDGADARPVLEDIEPVGYHAWLDMDTVGLFVLGEPPVFVVASPGEGAADGAGVQRLRSIGRSIHPVPGRSRFSVLYKASESDWRIVEVAPGDASGNGDPRTLAPALRPAEDYAWTPDGQLLMARGGRIFLHRTGDGQEWIELADFTARGIEQITRIVVSPRGDRIAFVVQR